MNIDISGIDVQINKKNIKNKKKMSQINSKK